MKSRSNKSVVILALLILVSAQPPIAAFAAHHKPTLAEIDAARKSEIERAKLAQSAKTSLSTAKRTLRQLTEIENAAHSKLVNAETSLKTAKKSAIRAQTRARAVSEVVRITHTRIGKLAANAYMMGGQLTDIESLLRANGPQELIDQLSLLNILGEGNRTALQRFTYAQRAAVRSQANAERARTLQQVETLKVSAAKRRAANARAEQEIEVAKLQLVQDQLQRALANAMKVRVTLEQRRQLALLEEARASRAAQTKGQSKLWKSDGTIGRLTSRTNQVQRNKAVEFARIQVLANKPYVWGAQGPNSFDCSGLVYAAYRFAGLGWPNWDRLNASLYYTYTKHVPFSEMQPGDLLFYSYDGKTNNIHHMSIYAGGGMVWEARSTRTGLRYSSMYSVEGLMPFAGRV